MQTFKLINEKVMENAMIEVSKSLGKTVTISETKRSLPQNSYYWSIVTIISKETGNTKDYLHCELCARTIGFRTLNVLGKEISIPKSSKELSKSEFSELIDAAHQVAGILGLSLPAPSYYGEQIE